MAANKNAERKDPIFHCPESPGAGLLPELQRFSFFAIIVVWVQRNHLPKLIQKKQEAKGQRKRSQKKQGIPCKKQRIILKKLFLNKGLRQKLQLAHQLFHTVWQVILQGKSLQVQNGWLQIGRLIYKEKPKELQGPPQITECLAEPEKRIAVNRKSQRKRAGKKPAAKEMPVINTFLHIRFIKYTT